MAHEIVFGIRISPEKGRQHQRLFWVYAFDATPESIRLSATAKRLVASTTAIESSFAYSTLAEAQVKAEKWAVELMSKKSVMAVQIRLGSKLWKMLKRA
jgi:hypothetical protein